MRSGFELFKRYAFLLGGLLVNAVGVVLLTKCLLGTSPLGSIPYVLSLRYPVSLGAFTFLLYLALFLIQLLLLGPRMEKRYWLQIPLSMIYSVFIDLAVSCVDRYTPANYGIMLGWLLLGCVLRALGVSMQVTADVAMLSGEAFTVVLARKLKKDFSLIKLFFDVFLVVAAVIMSVVLLGDIKGIREGTLISMVIVAPITGIFNRRFSGIRSSFPVANSAYKIKRHFKDSDNGFIITISSQSGSGGHAIGRILSQKLALPLYDNNLIDMIAKEGGFDRQYVNDKMGRLYTNRFWEFFAENYTYTSFLVDNYEPLYEAQKRVMEKLANVGNCIIVGYCSEYLLQNHDNVFSIYIHADKEAKKEFLSREYKVNSDKALEIMDTHDHDRAVYFKHFTGEKWNNPDRYSLSLDSSILGIEKTADAICQIIKHVI